MAKKKNGGNGEVLSAVELKALYFTHSCGETVELAPEVFTFSAVFCPACRQHDAPEKFVQTEG